MSFASDIKNELLKVEEKNEVGKLAQFYGMVLFSRLFTLKDSSYNCSSAALARRLCEDLAAEAGVMAQLDYSIKRRTGAWCVTIPDEEDRKRLLQLFGCTGEEFNLRLNTDFFHNEALVKAFLRGVFLMCGTASDPNKEYHLEFSVPLFKLSQDLMYALSYVTELNISPSIVNRKGNYVIYLKESEKIADFLVYIGATSASMDMMQVKMIKEVRNYVNRKTNFETANLEKTVSASVKQRDAIEQFIAKYSFDLYPDDLRETAILRYENPDMSLREMAETLGISRSGVNHRLKRITELKEI